MADVIIRECIARCLDLGMVHEDIAARFNAILELDDPSQAV